MTDNYLTDFSSSEMNEIILEDNKNIKIKNSKNEKHINSISKILLELIEKNKKLKNYKKIIRNEKNKFSILEKPNISIKDYLIRINNYLNPEESTLIISLILIDKLCCMSKIILNEFNIHRILFSSFLISMKINEDKIFTHKYFSSVAGIDIEELKILEFDFLKIVNYNVFVSKNIYEKYYQYLNQDI
jgi:hypothetical protein